MSWAAFSYTLFVHFGTAGAVISLVLIKYSSTAGPQEQQNQFRPRQVLFNSYRAVDIAVDTRSIVGRHSVDSRSTVGRQSVDTRSTVGRYSVDTRSTVGRYSGRKSVDNESTLGRDTVDSRSRCVSAGIAFRSPTLRRLFADTSPTFILVTTEWKYALLIDHITTDRF